MATCWPMQNSSAHIKRVTGSIGLATMFGARTWAPHTMRGDDTIRWRQSSAPVQVSSGQLLRSSRRGARHSPATRKATGWPRWALPIASFWLLGFQDSDAMTVDVVIGTVVAALAAFEAWVAHSRSPTSVSS